MALEITLKKSHLGQYSILFTGPSIWNKLSNNLEVLNIITSFTTNHKKLVMQNFREQNSILVITFNHYYYYQKKKNIVITIFLSSLLLPLLLL